MRFLSLEWAPGILDWYSLIVISDRMMKSKHMVYMYVAIRTGPLAYVVMHPFPGTHMPEMVTTARGVRQVRRGGAEYLPCRRTPKWPRMRTMRGVMIYHDLDQTAILNKKCQSDRPWIFLYLASRSQWQVDTRQTDGWSSDNRIPVVQTLAINLAGQQSQGIRKWWSSVRDLTLSPPRQWY